MENRIMTSDFTSTKSPKVFAKMSPEPLERKNIPKILFVEDDAIDQLTFEHYIKHQNINYNYILAKDVEDAVKAMEANAFDAIIVDYLLPDGTAFDVLRASKNTPVIFITGAGNEEVAVKAIKSGAYDYVIKDNTNNHLKVLPITVEKALERHATMERKRELEQELIASERQAYTGSVAAGIASDMNAILGSIIGFAQLASEDINNSNELSKDLKEVVCAAKKATFLIQEVLSLNYGGARSPSVTRPTSLGPIIETVLERLVATLPPNITVNKKIKELAGCYSIDVGSAYQIVNNLCTNAISAMRSTGGVLGITLVELERASMPATLGEEFRAEHCTRLTIKDTGVGMEPAIKRRIFEPFFTTKAPESIGLGLVVANSLVLKAGGIINVESEVAKGTVVDVYLPYRQEAPQIAISDLLLPKANVDLLAAKKIAVVEGDEQLQRLIRRIFLDVPGEVRMFSSSTEVFSHFAPGGENEFDIVVLDDTLDNVTSEVLARRIASLRPAVPIVVWCNYIRDLPQRAVRRIDRCYYLDKPFEAQKLLRTLTLICESVIKQ